MTRIERTSDSLRDGAADTGGQAHRGQVCVDGRHDAPLGSLSDTLPYPALIFDREGQLSHVNEELRHACGLTERSTTPRLAELLAPGDELALGRALAANLQDLSSFELELRLRHADGRERWHQLRVRPLMQRAHMPAWLRQDVQSAWIAVAYDVHDVKARERHIEATGAVRNNFLTVASHELRTPLTSLQLNLQLASQRLAAHSAPAREKDTLAIALKRSLREIRRLEEVVGDILDASRIRAGKLQLRPSEVCLRELVDEMVRVFERPFADCKCQVRLDIDENIVGLWDRERLSQVFFNLFANVQKHAPGSGIKVTARRKDERVKITIADNGPGIAPKFHKSIFRRFERATEVRGVSGLGLGLYLCRQIVAEHGGHMRVSSEQGCGSRFVIVLPRMPFCRVPQRPSHSPSARREPAGNSPS